MKNTALFLFLLVFIISCSEGDNKSNENPDNLNLTKVDSIQIPYLGLLNLMDVHPESGKVLLFNQQMGTLVVGGFEGNQVEEFAKNTDSPDSYGSFPLGAGKFSEDGERFTIISNQGVYTYDLQGNLIQGGKHQVEEMPAFSGRASVDMEFYWVEHKILTTGAGRTQYQRNTPEFYENYTSLAWFDTTARKVERFFYLDETSFFRNGKAHDIAHMIPRMTADKDHIYLIQGIEPALNIHSIQAPYEKITRVPLNIADYTFNQGQPFAEADPRMINPDIFTGIFENLKVTDEYILVSFFPGVPELDQDKYENMGWQELLPKLAVDYPKRMLVMDKQGNMLKEIPIPKEFNTRQWLERDGYLYFLASINLEEEEDFVKIYKVKLGE
ncbi:hypothetical protein [Belliella baltica]|nr:hypothetical protein [Belliella baltica]